MITEQTPRVALVSFLLKDARGPEELRLELFLTSELGQDGRSPLDDWAQILLTAKDDTNKEAVLCVNLGNVTPEEIACFKSKKSWFPQISRLRSARAKLFRKARNGRGPPRSEAAPLRPVDPPALDLRHRSKQDRTVEPRTDLGAHVAYYLSAKSAYACLGRTRWRGSPPVPVVKPNRADN